MTFGDYSLAYLSFLNIRMMIIKSDDNDNDDEVRVFFDINVGDEYIGRIIFRLYNKDVPIICESFRRLCTGENGVSLSCGYKPMHYTNTIFHRVIKGFMCQGGDFENNDGTGGESGYGGKLPDEGLSLHKHIKRGILSMANSGPNTNGSQFFITFRPCHHLDGKHVVFGEVIKGWDILNIIENIDTNERDKPINNDIIIIRSGQLIKVPASSNK